MIPEAEATYRTAAADLLAGLDRHLEGWITRVLREHLAGAADPGTFADRIATVARDTHAAVFPELEALLTADPDDQRAGPLAILRGCVGPANAVLADAGVVPPKRDPVTESMFPDDPYGLGPANFGDVDPDLHDTGLIWGAAKAHLVILRHRS